MYKYVLASVVLTTTLIAQAEDKKPAIDAAKLVGKYQFTAGEKYGKAMPEEMVKKMEMEITKDKMSMGTPEGKFVFGYTIDAKASPATIDLEILEGPIGKGSKAKGLIKQDGDSVTIIYASKPDSDRPKEFKTGEADGSLMFTVKKAK